MKKRVLTFILVFVLLLSGCGTSTSSDSDNDTSISDSNATGSDDLDSSETSNDTETSVEADFAEGDDEMFSSRDFEVEYDEASAVTIQLNGNTATSSSNSVQISGSTITITEEATYIISGKLNDGMIIIDTDDTAKLQLVLDNAEINSETCSPIYILKADKVFITLAEDSVNVLSNGGTFTPVDDNNIDAVIFSKQDLTINGTGSITITSPAGHGIVSKDDLVITGGTFTVNAASHGLDANDSVRIIDATMTIVAGKDGIHSENSDDTTLGFVYISSGNFDIDACGDGISGVAYMQIKDGIFDITTTVGEFSDETTDSWKGLKCTGDILISGGTFAIVSVDDAIHSNSSVTVNDGLFSIATGDDGIHADESLVITSGDISVIESYEGLEALDIDISGGIITLVASDDGLNAAGGIDSSGFDGNMGQDQFGGPGGGPGGHGGMGGNPGGMGSSSSNGSIVISGGDLYVNASGDGIDANGTIEISGGYTVVEGPTHGDTATLDFDTSATITGGTFIGTGASGMAQTFSDNEQGVFAVSVGNVQAGTEIILTDQSGKTIISHIPELDYSVIILSSPDIVSGQTYTITVGTESGSFEAY